jgi:hypothetical protein
MRVSGWQLVADPYEWLPPYGETAVSVLALGSDLRISIDYDSTDADRYRLMRKDILFSGVSCYHKELFPGPALLEIAYACDKFDAGLLIEFVPSELAEAVKNMSTASGLVQDVHHYRIAFLSENVKFDVLAKAVVIEDAYEPKA